MDTIRELILQDIQTTLEGITVAGGFATDIRTVERSRVNPHIAANHPSAFIYEDTDSPLTSVVNQKHTRSMTVTVTFWIRSHDDLSGAVNAFYGDIVKAMMADRCRGDNAIDTSYGAAEFTVGDESGPLGGGQVEFAITYRHSETDPAVA